MKRLTYPDQALLFFICGTVVGAGFLVKGALDGNALLVILGVVTVPLGVRMVVRVVRTRRAAETWNDKPPPG